MTTSVGGVGFRVDFDPAAFKEVGRTAAGRLLRQAGELVTQEAKRLSPTSPDGSHGRPSGYLRSSIGFELHEDGDGPYCDVGSQAFTPDGFDYGLAQELGPAGSRHFKFTPYLRPALDVLP